MTTSIGFPPDEALATFRLVKSAGRLRNAMYLLAFDRSPVDAAVRNPYLSEGPHFLEMILQACRCALKVDPLVSFGRAPTARRASTCRNPSHRRPIRAQTGACVGTAYPTDWPERVFELPIRASCAMTNAITSSGRMLAKLYVNERASVTEGEHGISRGKPAPRSFESPLHLPERRAPAPADRPRCWRTATPHSWRARPRQAWMPQRPEWRFPRQMSVRGQSGGRQTAPRLRRESHSRSEATRRPWTRADDGAGVRPSARTTIRRPGQQPATAGHQGICSTCNRRARFHPDRPSHTTSRRSFGPPPAPRKEVRVPRSMPSALHPASTAGCFSEGKPAGGDRWRQLPEATDPSPDVSPIETHSARRPPWLRPTASNPSRRDRRSTHSRQAPRSRPDRQTLDLPIARIAERRIGQPESKRQDRPDSESRDQTIVPANLSAGAGRARTGVLAIRAGAQRWPRRTPPDRCQAQSSQGRTPRSVSRKIPPTWATTNPNLDQCASIWS